MPFPRNCCRSGDDPTQKASVSHDASQGHQKRGDVALEICERRKITEEAKYQAACADMRGSPAKQPGEKPSEQYAAHRYRREFGLAARADNASQYQQGQRVCGEVPK